MECALCKKIKEREHIVYEDDLVIALLLKEAVAQGHVLVTTKNHLTLDQLSEGQIVQLYYAANFAASIIFELLKLDGTNIISTNINDHFTINIIPRKRDDTLDFTWDPLTVNQTEMDSLLERIKDALPIEREIEEKTEAVDMDEKRKEIITETENYLIKQLKRIP
ncbi:hypothetical protein DRJ17_02110 [Candidatus Woesearchaeota archaeon]|nr:MAG: hypothetical protein DRJ17_02110 [Candidatus Woesearchaeota archaeon]